jgi:hypothetical protein
MRRWYRGCTMMGLGDMEADLRRVMVSTEHVITHDLI